MIATVEEFLLYFFRWKMGEIQRVSVLRFLFIFSSGEGGG